MVTEQKNSTPMQEWVAQALEKLRPILDGDVPYANLRKGLMDLDVGEDAMADALDRIEWLVQHFKVLPEPPPFSDGWIDGYHIGYQAGYLSAMEWTRDKVKEMRMEAQV